MSKKSAGILLYKYNNELLEVLLVHPGGPFWKNKDEGSWSIPKGEYEDGDEPFAVAKREFNEETGYNIDEITKDGAFHDFETLKQPSGKKITAWATEGDCDSRTIKSNLFSIEWPPRSGKLAEFPEVDRAEWFPIKEANIKILKGQKGFIDQLCKLLAYDSSKEPTTSSENEIQSKTIKKGKQLNTLLNSNKTNAQPPALTPSSVLRQTRRSTIPAHVGCPQVNLLPSAALSGQRRD